jgi:DNA polymerase zeta
MAKPIHGLDVSFSALHGTALDQVPVIRIFGSTPAGQRACLHVHKAFPYMYIKWAGDQLPR